MTKKNNKKNYFKILLFVVTILLIFLIFNINNLKKEIYQLESENYKLESEKKDLEKNFENLDEQYSLLKNETNFLLMDINTYQEEIEDSLEWYKKNSVLTDSFEQKKVKKQIDYNCIEIKEDECKIKLGCFYLINSEKLNLDYKHDEALYEKDDKLTSISDFLKNKGGDCEDYSLFFKAEYNYALSQCEDKKIILEGWKHPNSTDKETKYWLNFQKTWYLEDVSKIEIKNNIYPNIICGNLYDPILEDVAGHCMIAFTKNEINSIEDLSDLDDAHIIEPQDGSFQGNINKENSDVYLLNEDILKNENITSFVYSVITNNDYFLFSESDLNWKSYNSFNDQLSTKKNELLSLLS